MLPAFGLYTHIRANRWRSAILLVGLFVLVYLLTFAFALLLRGWEFGTPADAGTGLSDYLHAAFRDLIWLAPVTTVVTALWVTGSYFFHQGLINLVTGSCYLAREDSPRLYNLLENLCVSRGMAMPKLRVMPTAALNAFATGLNDRQYAITVTSGLLDALDDAEVEAVLAHELTHIRNDDVRMMVVAVVIAGVITFFAELVFRYLGHVRGSSGSSKNGKGKGGGGAFAAILIALVLIAVAWALSLVIRFALSRSREYLADAGAVELTKNPDAMISALVKIKGKGEIEGVPSGVMEMCVDNPRSGFTDLLASHPPIDERIDALMRFAGGHLPALAPPGAAASTAGSSSAEAAPI